MGKVVPLKKPSSAKNEETRHKERLLKWRSELADKVLEAVRADVALHFLDHVDDEESSALDLRDDYNPIIDAKTGTRLSDAIAEFAEETGRSEKELRRLYKNTLKAKFKAQKQNHPTEPDGKRYGRRYLANQHGIWTRLDVAGPELFVWRRITRTKVDHTALSYDTSSQQNLRHHYLITGETGELSVSIGNEKLGKDANCAIIILMRHGVHVVESKEARQHLAVFLRYKPRMRIVRAPRVGWFEPKRGSLVFVLPSETLGDAKVTVTLDTFDGASKHHGLHRSGTLEQWQQEIAAPFARNSNVILAVGASFAGPLLRFADEPGGGFHFHGGSKIGKTLASAIAQSVWGKPYFPGAGSDTFGFTWESTANRLGQRAVLRSDLMLYLDEIGVGDQKVIGNAAYKIAAGLDRGRFGQPERDFNILFLSTGELALAKFLPNVRAGQLVRLVDIPAVRQCIRDDYQGRDRERWWTILPGN